jgi:hypothetical protein
MTGAIVGGFTSARAFPATVTATLEQVNPDLELQRLAADLLTLRLRTIR